MSLWRSIVFIRLCVLSCEVATAARALYLVHRHPTSGSRALVRLNVVVVIEVDQMETEVQSADSSPTTSQFYKITLAYVSNETLPLFSLGPHVAPAYLQDSLSDDLYQEILQRKLYKEPELGSSNAHEVYLLSVS